MRKLLEAKSNPHLTASQNTGTSALQTSEPNSANTCAAWTWMPPRPSGNGRGWALSVIPGQTSSLQTREVRSGYCFKPPSCGHGF